MVRIGKFAQPTDQRPRKTDRALCASIRRPLLRTHPLPTPKCASLPQPTYPARLPFVVSKQKEQVENSCPVLEIRTATYALPFTKRTVDCHSSFCAGHGHWYFLYQKRS